MQGYSPSNRTNSFSGQKGLLFLGNGGASVSAVRGARIAGYSGDIQVVADSKGPVFNPMLSPYYLDGKIPFGECFPFGMDFYEKQGVTCRFGIKADRLDPINGEVYLEDGECLPYDKCLIATGASPVLPDLPGLRDSPNVFTLRTAEDARGIHEAASYGKKTVILGASLIGIKLADIFVRQGIGVTLVDVADQLLPNTAHSLCAGPISGHIAARGVDLHLGWRLESVEDRGKGIDLFFNNKRSMEADFCVLCIGVRPNLDLVSKSGIDTDQGIIVDERMRTSAQHLYAAGDVSQGINLLSGKKELIGLWGNAFYQGRTAGVNMAGGEANYYGTIPSHISTFFGLSFVHLGDVNRRGKDVVTISHGAVSDKTVYRLFVFDRGVMVGANLINCFQYSGRLRSAILRRLDWTEYLHRLSDNPTDRVLDQILYSLNA